jgi:hypothetical protein
MSGSVPARRLKRLLEHACDPARSMQPKVVRLDLRGLSAERRNHRKISNII